MDAATGRVNEGAPAFEQFAVGGPATSLADEALLSQRRPLAALASGALRGRTLWTAKAAVPRYSLQPFAWIGSTEGRPSPAKLLGMEWAGFEWQPHRGCGVPGGSLTAGATYALGDPPGRRWGAFVRLAYTH